MIYHIFYLIRGHFSTESHKIEYYMPLLIEKKNSTNIFFILHLSYFGEQLNKLKYTLKKYLMS